MLIDKFLPRYDVAARYGTDVAASVERTYGALHAADLSGSPAARWLFRLRGMPNCSATLGDASRLGFISLGEEPPRGLLLGIVGRFWTPRGDLVPLDAAGFRSFDRPGYAKAAWAFTLDPRPDGSTRLATETRVLCLDDASRRRFRMYWALIGPFSGLIRKELLRAVKKAAEREEAKGKR